jgi:hypothetical protein
MEFDLSFILAIICTCKPPLLVALNIEDFRTFVQSAHWIENSNYGTSF